MRSGTSLPTSTRASPAGPTGPAIRGLGERPRSPRSKTGYHAACIVDAVLDSHRRGGVDHGSREIGGHDRMTLSVRLQLSVLMFL